MDPELEKKEIPTNDSFDWEKYRKIIDDHTEGARKLGLLNKELAENSLRDPRSIIVDVDGIDMPVFVPIEYAEGYDTERTKQIITEEDGNPEEAYYYCLPPGIIDTNLDKMISEMLISQKSHDMFVYFDYDSQHAEVRVEFEKIISALGKKVRSIPLFDPDLRAEKQQSAISLYAVSVRQIQSAENENSLTDIYTEFTKAVSQGEREMLPFDGQSLLKGEDVSPELREEMWQLYLERFKNLGEYHPITMEEDRKGFDSKFKNTDTTFSISFKDGKPVCWMCFLTDMTQCEWLNPNYFTSDNLGIAEDESLLFFPEIVARADGIGGYSEPTLQLAIEFAARTGRNYKVCFESTNRSSEYIPYLVRKYIENSGKMSVAKPEKVDETLYACYKITEL